IEELESLSAKSAQENQKLKTLVEKLQDENFILKQTSFNFEFSLTKTDESTTDIDKDITDLVSPQAVKSTLSSTPTENTLNPYTPPSSNASDDEPSTPNPTPVGESDTANNGSSSSQKSSPHILPLIFNSYDPSISVTTASAPVSAPVQSHSSKPKNAEEFCEKLTDGICQGNDENESSSRLSSAFTEYRDPTPFITNVDNPFSESTPLAPLFEENLQDFGSYAPMATPIDENKPSGYVSLDDKSKKFLPCTK
ncbi:14607_t:CDS:1, partial [Acaulospora morrowiae]